MLHVFFFFFTLVTGPRRSLSLKLSDTRAPASPGQLAGQSYFVLISTWWRGECGVDVSLIQSTKAPPNGACHVSCAWINTEEERIKITTGVPRS